MTKHFINEFTEALVMDELTFEDLETQCKLTYKMGLNPLPTLRVWIEKARLDAAVHYVESNMTPISKEALLRKINTRVNPLVIVEAVKSRGLTVEVNIYINADKLYSRKDFAVFN